MTLYSMSCELLRVSEAPPADLRDGREAAQRAEVPRKCRKPAPGPAGMPKCSEATGVEESSKPA